jgi:hypothetical protein
MTTAVLALRADAAPDLTMDGTDVDQIHGLEQAAAWLRDFVFGPGGVGTLGWALFGAAAWLYVRQVREHVRDVKDAKHELHEANPVLREVGDVFKAARVIAVSNEENILVRRVEDLLEELERAKPRRSR